MAFNLTRAAGTIASRFHAKATTATIRNQLIRNYRWNRLPSPPRKPTRKQPDPRPLKINYTKKVPGHGSSYR